MQSKFNFRNGSLAAATTDGDRVRFTPESCRGFRRGTRQLSAMSSHGSPFSALRGELPAPGAISFFKPLEYAQTRLPWLG